MRKLLPKWRTLLCTGGLLAAALVGPARAYAAATGEDDPDFRPNVTVPTKRQSIESTDLPKLVRLTEENSPLVRQAKITLELAELNRGNARAAFFPKLTLDATTGYQDTYPTVKSPWTPYTSSLNLVATENLYDNGTSLINWEQTTLRYQRARMNYDLQRDQALLTMAEAYLDWSASVRNREIDENRRDLLQRQFHVLEVQYRQGLKTKRDVLRIETEVRRQDLAILSRDNEVDLNFQRLAGTAGVTLAELKEQDIEMEDVKPYVSIEALPPQIELKNHRQTQMYEFDKKDGDLNVRLAKRSYWPSISVSADAGDHLANFYGNTTPLYKDTSYSWEALLKISYTIWDFGTLKRGVEIARVNADNVNEGNRITLLSLNNDLRDLWNKLRENRESVKLSRELLVLEQQSYNLLEAEYRAGRTNYLDLIGSLNSLIDARSRLASAYYGLRRYQMIYAFHKGNLYETVK